MRSATLLPLLGIAALAQMAAALPAGGSPAGRGGDETGHAKNSALPRGLSNDGVTEGSFLSQMKRFEQEDSGLKRDYALDSTSLLARAPHESKDGPHEKEEGTKPGRVKRDDALDSTDFLPRGPPNESSNGAHEKGQGTKPGSAKRDVTHSYEEDEMTHLYERDDSHLEYLDARKEDPSGQNGPPGSGHPKRDMLEWSNAEQIIQRDDPDVEPLTARREQRLGQDPPPRTMYRGQDGRRMRRFRRFRGFRGFRKIGGSPNLRLLSNDLGEYRRDVSESSHQEQMDQRDTSEDEFLNARKAYDEDIVLDARLYIPPFKAIPGTQPGSSIVRQPMPKREVTETNVEDNDLEARLYIPPFKAVRGTQPGSSLVRQPKSKGSETSTVGHARAQRPRSASALNREEMTQRDDSDVQLLDARREHKDARKQTSPPRTLYRGNDGRRFRGLRRGPQSLDARADEVSTRGHHEGPTPTWGNAGVSHGRRDIEAIDGNGKGSEE